MDIMLERRSIRKYKPDPVPKELLDQVIEAGLYAPSGKNQQSSAVIAITDPKVIAELSGLNAEVHGTPGSDPFYGAPAVLLVIADKSEPNHVYDGTLMMGNMMNKAYELGLGSCWINRAKQVMETGYGKELLAKLGITGEWEGIANMIIGYADETPAPKPRKEGRVYYI